MKKVFGVVVIGLLLVAFGAQSAFAAGPYVEDGDRFGVDCAGPSDSFRLTESANACGVVTNRILGFNAHGGEVSVDQTLRVTHVNETHATYERGSAFVAQAWNTSSWQWFNSILSRSGIASFAPAGGALSAPVAVKYDWVNLNGINDGTPRDGMYSLTCSEQAYLVCQTPEIFSHARGFPLVTDITGFASIESRPLIVKIINQTDQPLVRSSEARMTGLLRDDQVADPITINAMHNGRVGNGYYHFYRDSSKANNATVSYTFGAGSEGSALTHGVIDINIVVDEAGDTTTSSCRPPDGLDVTVQCAVTMIGSADGILTAIVSIGA